MAATGIRFILPVVAFCIWVGVFFRIRSYSTPADDKGVAVTTSDVIVPNWPAADSTTNDDTDYRDPFTAYRVPPKRHSTPPVHRPVEVEPQRAALPRLSGVIDGAAILRSDGKTHVVRAGDSLGVFKVRSVWRDSVALQQQKHIRHVHIYN